MIINGHNVERKKLTGTMELLIIDSSAELQQIDLGFGRVKISGKAWDQAQKDLIKETFPNLVAREEFRGSRTWIFRSL